MKQRTSSQHWTSSTWAVSKFTQTECTISMWFLQRRDIWSRLGKLGIGGFLRVVCTPVSTLYAMAAMYVIYWYHRWWCRTQYTLSIRSVYAISLVMLNTFKINWVFSCERAKMTMIDQTTTRGGMLSSRTRRAKYTPETASCGTYHSALTSLLAYEAYANQIDMTK